MHRITVGLAALAVALMFAAAAQASTLTGGVVFSDSLSCRGCPVKIHNNNTGGNGSTTTDSSGFYSFTGIVYDYSYNITAQVYCPRIFTTVSRTYTGWKPNVNGWVASFTLGITRANCGAG